MEGVLSNITISEFFPTTVLDEQQSKKIKLQNSSYNNITEKYKRESEKNTVSEFSKQISQEDVTEQTVPTNEAIKEPISLPALKDVIELVRYQETTPIQVGEYRPIKISTSMEANIISKYSVEENSKPDEVADNYKINFSDTDILFKANKKYMDITPEDANSDIPQDAVVAPERDEYYQEEIKHDYVNDEDIKPTDEEVYKEETGNSYEEESNSERNNVEVDSDDKNSDSEEDYGKLIEKLKQERDAAAQRAKVASSNYNETKVKLAEAADKYVAI